MAQPEIWSPLKIALIDKLIIPRIKPETAGIKQSVFSQASLHSYFIEMKKAIMLMQKYTPSEFNTPFKGNCLEVTECGQFFVFGSMEGRVAVVDRDSKEILHDIQLEGGSIYSIALYCQDSLLLAGGKDGIIRKFDFQTFEEIGIMQGHEKEVNSLIVSSDELRAFSASDDLTVRVWNLESCQSRVLYFHEKAVLCLDLSKDNKTLVSGGGDKVIRVYSIEQEAVIKVLSEFSSSVWAVKLSPNCAYVAGGDSTGVIKLWNLDGFKVLRVFTGHENRVTHIEFNLNESILVSSSNDTTLRVWDVLEEKHEIILSGHSDWVKSFKISKDEDKIYSIAENFKIMSWQFPKSDKSCCRKEHNTVITHMCYSRVQNYLFTADVKELKVWDLENNKTLYKTFKPSFMITALCIDSDNKIPVVAFSNNEVHYWLVEDNETVFKFKHSSIISSLIASPDGVMLVCGDYNFRVTVYNKRNFSILNVFRRHTSVIACLAFSKPVMNENNQLFSGGEDKQILMYSLKENKSFRFPVTHNSAISAINVSRNNELLISGDNQGVFKVWHILQQLCMKSVSMHTHKITGIYFSENSKYFWVSSRDSSVSLWNYTSFAEVTKFKTKYPVSAFCCSKNEAEMIMAENEEVQFLDNPLRTNQFFVYGPGTDYYSFMKYILQIVNDNEVEYNPEMDKWIITPYEINALHFYVYLNLPQHLKLALQNNSPFYYSKSGYSPLQIAIHRNFRDCINIIIKSITLRVQEDPYSIGYLEDSIIKLNQIGFRGLDEFYSSILYKSKDKLLPKFCSDAVNLPVLVLSNNLGPNQRDFFDSDQIAGCGRPLTFWQSALKVDSVMGSVGSIAFLESITECPNSNIFTAPFIRELVLYKWGYLKWVLLPQALLYVIYMIILSAYLIIFDGKQEAVLIVIFIINIMLSMYEMYQMALTKLIYLSDPWNYIDFLRAVLCFTYVGMMWNDYNSFISMQLLVSVTFVTMVRGISYFRLFDNTRYMINLLTEVLKDMRSFLILLAYSTYSFALIYFIMVNNIDKYSSANPSTFEIVPFSDFVKTSYLLNLGNFETNNYEAFEWVIFFFASVINPLIMLNLLISIMGDTFGRVKEEQEIADMKELTEMVIEGEYLLFCKRGAGRKTYMQICKEEELTTSELGLDSQLAKMKAKIKMIENSVNKKSDDMKTEIRTAISGINNKVDEMTGIVEQISLTQDL